MNNGVLIWLDDIRDPNSSHRMFNFSYYKEVVWLKSYVEFCSYIEENGLPEAISFDHDLGDGPSGKDCANFLIEYCMDNHCNIPIITVHSQNPVGAENINSLISNYLDFCKRDH